MLHELVQKAMKCHIKGLLHLHWLQQIKLIHSSTFTLSIFKVRMVAFLCVSLICFLTSCSSLHLFSTLVPLVDFTSMKVSFQSFHVFSFNFANSTLNAQLGHTSHLPQHRLATLPSHHNTTFSEDCVYSRESFYRDDAL